jgi:hypothetical protein
VDSTAEQPDAPVEGDDFHDDSVDHVPFEWRFTLRVG